MSRTATRSAAAMLRERIRAQGPLTFAAFMAHALYDPETGYYAQARLPLGARGDYYTSPELHPGFAALLGRQVEQLWAALGRPVRFVLHEAGPGSGRFARDLLDWLQARAPDLYAALEYRLDEPSPALRLVQQRELAHAGHEQRARWVAGLQPANPAQLIIANEVLDALPVHLVQVRGGRLEELFVALEGDRFVLVPAAPSTAALGGYFERLGRLPGEGCRAEVNLAALAWMERAARSLERGLLLVLDYGYPAELLYAPERRYGTLLCYYRHTLNSDPLARVGEQDITSHVDFTSVRAAGERAGLRTLGLISQHRLLHNLGWAELVAAVRRVSLPPAEREANVRALEALVDPTGLGRILALFQARGLPDFVPLGLVGGPALDWSSPPLRRPDHVRLPDPAEAESLGDFESQWAEFCAAIGAVDEPAAVEPVERQAPGDTPGSA